MSWSRKQRSASSEAHIVIYLFVCLFVLNFDSLHPSQQFFSHVGTGLPGLNLSTKLRIKCLAQGHKAVPPVRLMLL